jgi:Transglutaminase elicitor
MKLLSLIASMAVLAIANSCGENSADVAETWNSANDPLLLKGDYDRNFSALPTQGTVEVKPWSDTYWPSKEGGIAARWLNPSFENSAFSYNTFSLEEVQSMNVGQLRSLSPAEKFDIFRGDFSYPTVAFERSTKRPSAAGWEGLCHGWAPASMLFSEPNPIEIEGANGITVPFGSSDVKALLTFYQANLSRAPTRILGARCNQDIALNPADGFRDECKDTNAGAFHVVMANQLGLQNEAFLADVTRDLQVWNQPIHSYKSQILSYQSPSDGAAEGTVREAVIRTRMAYTLETEANYESLNSGGRADGQKIYTYRLELNDRNQIIGGEWISDERPDFLWMQERTDFTGKWLPLEKIYNQSTGN